MLAVELLSQKFWLKVTCASDRHYPNGCGNVQVKANKTRSQPHVHSSVIVSGLCSRCFLLGTAGLAFPSGSVPRPRNAGSSGRVELQIQGYFIEDVALQPGKPRFRLILLNCLRAGSREAVICGGTAGDGAGIVLLLAFYGAAKPKLLFRKASS
jgi:hypothetical protein